MMQHFCSSVEVQLKAKRRKASYERDPTGIWSAKRAASEPIWPDQLRDLLRLALFETTENV
jgi:hypothetical protein